MDKRKTKIILRNRAISFRELIEEIKSEFAKHIGEEQGVRLEFLLNKFFPESEDWTVWRKYTYLDIIKRAIGVTRRQHDLFIINKNGVFFVLQTQEEADFYKDILKRDILSMQKSIKNADLWIKKQRWKEVRE